MKAYIISLSKIPSSAESSKKVLEKLLEYGFDAELFEGTYGYDSLAMFEHDQRRMSKYGIKSITVSAEEFNREFPDVVLPPEQKTVSRRARLDEVGKMMRPGVVGCFYSHYRLWQKCLELNEPIFIFEDDVIFYRHYEPVEWQEVLLVCLGKQAHLHDFYSKKLYNPEGRPGVVKLHNTSMPGAVGYGLTPQGAKKLVEYYREEFLPADTAMNQYVVRLECHTHLMGRAATDEDGKVSLTTSKMWNKLK
jgi:GR25 family glycosyltransferase involved in LPS biosynthesis